MRRVRPALVLEHVQARSKTTLGSLLRGARGPLDARRAVSIALDIAEDLAEREARPSPPGPLSPDVVIVDEERAAIAWGDAKTDEGSIAPMWCPPAQADGQPFDHEANRWVLGLMLYKMLTGSHPFSGGGLRRALEAAAKGAEAPPFKAEIAQELPAGLQALTLRILNPDASKRPPSAEAIADSLSRFHAAGAGGNIAQPDVFAARVSAPVIAPVGRLVDELPTLPSEGVKPRRRPAPVDDGRSPGGVVAKRSGAQPVSAGAWMRMLLPIAIGIAVALAALASLRAPKKADKPSVKVGSQHVLDEGDLDAQSCASCHARQASEWRRSVMGHSVKSPLFNALESLIEEQVGRDFDCPNGAGILRKTNSQVACVDRNSGLPVSGSGGEHWCVNCHAPLENLEKSVPVWEGRANGDPRSRHPVKDIISDRAMEGITCTFCHTAHGPVNPRGRGGYQGNPTWTSFVTGQTFPSRPEDRLGVFGIANSGYELAPSALLLGKSTPPVGPGGTELVHARPDESMRRYLKSSEFCGSCHDVRLFGSDVVGAERKGENFKRLRNAYSEWKDWAAVEKRRGREAATCQGCHMSEFPGVCVPDPKSPGDDICPEGSSFEKRAPNSWPKGHVASSSEGPTPITTHYLSGVDLPLSHEYPEDLLDESSLDVARIPISAKARRDALLKAAFSFQMGEVRLRGDRLEVPLVIENVAGGHRIPAGFSQEREFWVHLTVKDARGRVVYEVGRVDRNDEDLRDKIFERVNTDPTFVDGQGRPVGLFGADVRDGPDVPLWSPNPALGGTRFVGRGLINFQNGFERCVRCIGFVAADGTCQPAPGQERFRADRFADGAYDIDTGRCESNLSGSNALFETYFPVGSLDSTRGLPKAPDAIIDTRSVPPNVPLNYTYDLDVGRGVTGPFTVRARLLFRAFPPFLIRAFADYERRMAQLGRRPSGALVDETMMKRLEVVEIAKIDRTSGVK